MNTADFTRLKRKHLIEHFENERQDWLAAGMGEADIFRIHFGEQDENGRGGDYRVWLDERKHKRPDRKYAPGEPLPFNDTAYDCKPHSERCYEVGYVEVSTDLDRALMTLTSLQRRYFIMNRIEGYSYAEIARLENKYGSTIRRITESAVTKIKKYF